MLSYVLGGTLKVLRHDNLPDHYEDISVRDDELAVAGMREKKLLLFSMEV